MALVLAIVAATFVSAAPASAGQPPPGYPTDEIKRIVYNSYYGNSIPIRRGFYDADINEGFGFDKVWWKHKIMQLDAMQYGLQSPRRFKSGNQYIFRSYAQQFVCDTNGCVLQQEVEVQAVYEPRSFSIYYGWPVGGKLGLLTMYCIGYFPECPHWVDDGLSNALHNSQLSAASGRTTFDSSAGPSLTQEVRYGASYTSVRGG
ncbi:MAG TPA: hypothetical protein VFR67_03610 [Pilimelia sp.]|nr:hypothetical protein [Pilimelia sp.]